MFGAPPQPSKKELEAAEAQTITDIKWTAASAVVLYFCTCGKKKQEMKYFWANFCAGG
ncbi:hypothetical protein BDU57DRAFT_514804 [Ampelomyces quisqualis]|uniref:Uncharacterized protein n=1 Tax=Ampelomyces quisqualis TaxID=50730 RepID=A0A6A5QR89_AMPQU|nr:hypothetical protein BDU57DRAFT_514804 [Ampelomyces quisqualis]